MTKDELTLLLTVARILRATIRDMLPTANGLADIEDLSEALRPYDPDPVAVINQERR